MAGLMSALAGMTLDKVPAWNSARKSMASMRPSGVPREIYQSSQKLNLGCSVHRLPTYNEAPRSKLRGITELNFEDFSETEENPVASYGECSSSFFRENYPETEDPRDCPRARPAKITASAKTLATSW